MNRQQLLIVAPLMLIISCVFVAAAAEPDAGNNAANEFAGKIVCVRMINDKMVLENAKIIVHGTESFLAGTGIKRSDSNARRLWWEGLPIRLNMRFVESYFLVTREQWAAIGDTFVIPAPSTQ